MNERSNSSRQLLTTLLLTALFSAGASAQSVLNGDFESPSGVFTSWTTNAGATTAAQAISDDFSVRLGANTGNSGNALNQTLTDPMSLLTEYSLSFDFAASDPGSSSSRSFQLSLRTTPGLEGGNINMRIVRGSAAGLGTLQVFSGSWSAALVDAVNFSSSETGAGFVINSMVIDADYSVTPSYTITVNGTASALLSAFQSGAPSAGDTLQQISFQSGNLVAGSWSVVDNINLLAIPEPSVCSLLGLALAGLVLRRRHR